jgi:hypothetical protein
MKTIKKQLTAFYKKQGKRGYHLGRAVKADMERVAKNKDFVIKDENYLDEVFTWGFSPEGYYYWYERNFTKYSGDMK